jgi:acyl dehydratase
MKENKLIYFEDLNVGSLFDLGDLILTRKEIVSFARQYDPQPFHLDEAAAAKTNFGGIIASGWQTCCLFQRLLVDGFLGNVACLGSPGVSDLRFIKPVFPEDQLTGKLSIGEKRLSKSRLDRGTVKLECVMFNGEAEAVFAMNG